MIKKFISRVFIIITSIAFLQILGTIIVARNLTKSEMGLYRLALTIVELASVVSLMGIDHSFVRFFSSPKISFSEYNWKYFLKGFSIIALSLIFIVATIVSIIYKFSPFVILFLIVVIIMLTSILIFTSFLRARQKYELAIFLSRVHFLIFPLFLITSYIFKILSLKNVLLSYMTATILANFVVIYYCMKNMPIGKKPIPLSVLKNGFYYFGLGVSLILILQTGPLLIGKMLSYRDLAVYAVIVSVMRIFEFVQDSSYYVLAPYLNVKIHISAKKIFLVLLFVGIGVSLIYILFGKILVHFFFKGLYDEGFYLIPLFIGIGVVRTLYVLPASIIGGRSSERVLRNQFYLTCLAAILNIFLTHTFIQKWELRGAVLANLITWCIVLVMSLLGTKGYMKSHAIRVTDSYNSLLFQSQD